MVVGCCLLCVCLWFGEFVLGGYVCVGCVELVVEEGLCVWWGLWCIVR